MKVLDYGTLAWGAAQWQKGTLARGEAGGASNGIPQIQRCYWGRACMAGLHSSGLTLPLKASKW